MLLNVDFQMNPATLNVDFNQTQKDFQLDLGNGIKGDPGATFIPSVSEDGTISWINDGNLPNPFPRNIMGPIGPMGLTGPEGPQGPQGLQGMIGPQGPIGEEGPQGPRGEKGIQGSPGPIGPEGSVGPRGPQGPQGLQGERGLEGPIGPAGPTGPTGQEGPIGLTGPQGATGPAGPQGEPGPQGDIGNPGPEGPQGLQGPPGQDGNVSFDNLTPDQQAQLKGEPGLSAYESAQIGGYEGTEEEFYKKLSQQGGINFTTDETLTLSSEGVLSVNTATVVEKDNTLPVTSAAVDTTVGNISILLDLI